MVVSNMTFAGISGSALADAAGLGVIGIPARSARATAAHTSNALTLCSSVIAMIPPSTIRIYGVIAQESIGRLFGRCRSGFIIGFA
jgi:TRAP-type C4-dicarboxylate transport system permease large subunit